MSRDRKNHVPQYISMRDAPPNRRRWLDGVLEAHFTEASVMLAFARHLIAAGATRVEVHPDGLHVRSFDLAGHLHADGYVRDASGQQTCAGTYMRSGISIEVSMRSGLGDVVGEVGSARVLAECKGGIINTRHPGQLSKLRKGVCEAAGQLLGRARSPVERHVAVVPYTRTTLVLARKMAPRCSGAGIEIALVKADGEVIYASEDRDIP